MDRPNRELYLVGEPQDILTLEEGDVEPGVEYLQANRIIKNLRVLTLDSGNPILIHMKTCGGDENEGFAIYDAIRLCPCYVTILSYTHARSMSSIILQAADKRLLMPHSYMMVHWGTAVFGGAYASVSSEAAFAKKREDSFLNIYADAMKTGGIFAKWSKKRIREMLRQKMGEKGDVFLLPPEAVAWGLADGVFAGKWKELK